MRILHVVKDLGLNGAARVVRTLADAQVQRGEQVALMAIPGELGDDFSGPVFDLPPTGKDPRMLPEAVRALRSAIREFAPDVVNAHNPGIMMLVGVGTLRGRTVPAITTLHGSAPEQYRFNAYAAKVAGLPIIACGPTVAEQMRDAGHPVQATILNGVRVSATQDPAEVRAGLGVPADVPFLVQVGRLAPQKNPVLAVEAFAQGAPPEAVFAFVGDGDERDTVRAAIDRLGLGERVKLLGGRTDAHDIMRAADVVTLTSNWEGHPLVLLEAMYLGRPVLATRAPGSRELVRDGVDGLLTEETPEAVGAAMARLCGDANLRARLGAAALARADEFGQERMTDAYLEAYRRILR